MAGACDVVDVGVEEYAKGAVDLEQFAKKVKARLGADIDPEHMQAIFERAAARYERSGGSELRAIKLELAKELAKAHKTGFVEGALGFRKANLLSGPRTLVRNTIGNTVNIAAGELDRIPAALVDMGLSKITGKRTILAADFKNIGKGLQSSVTKGLADAWETLKNGATPDELLKFDFPREIHTPIAPLNAYVNGMMRLQSAADKPFREYAFKRALMEQAQLAEKNGMGKAADLIANPDEGMVLRAVADAEMAVFANSNKLASWINSGKAKGGGVGSALDFFVPFTKVPTNITANLISRLPGTMAVPLWKLLKHGLTEETQRDISIAFGRNTTGAGLLYAGYLMYDRGLIQPYVSQSSGQKDRDEAAGKVPGTVLVDGRRYRLADHPIGSLLSLGAAMRNYELKFGKRREKRQEEGDPGSDLALGMAKAVGKAVADIPALEGVETANKLLNEPDKTLKSQVGQTASSFVPASKFVETIAMAGDRPVKRQAETAADYVKLGIPGMRSEVPVKTSATGKEIPIAEWFSTWGGTPESYDPVILQFLKVDAPLTMPAKNIPGESNADYQARKARWGAKFDEVFKRVISGERFQSMTPTQKRLALQKATRAIRTRLGEKEPAKQEAIKNAKRAEAEQISRERASGAR